MRIRTRFRLALWASSAVLAIAVAFVLAASFYIGDILTQYLQYERLADNVVALRTATMEYANSPSERLRDQWRRLYEIVHEDLVGPAEAPADIADAYDRIGSVFTMVGDIGQESRTAAQGAPPSHELRDRLLFSALTETQRVVDWARHCSDEANGRFRNALRGYGAATLALVVLIAAITWAIVLSSGRRIVRSVLTLKEGAQTISRGALDHRIGLTGGDEFAELADTFNAMTDDLRTLYERMSQTNRSLRTLSRCNDILVRSTDEAALLDGIVKLLVTEGRYRLALVALADEAGALGAVFQAGNGTAERRALDGDREPVVRAFDTRSPMIIQDISRLDAGTEWREEALARGFMSIVALPLMSEETAIGALGIWSGDRNVFSDSEVALLSELANDVSYGLSALRDRSEHAHAEEHLAQLAAAVEQSGEDIIITDPEGIIRYVNPAFEKTTGLGREESVGHSVMILESGKTDPTVIREMWEIMRTGGTWRGRLVNRTKDQREIVQETAASAIHDQAGHCVGLVWAQRDITAQLQMEEHLSRSQRLQAIGTLAGGIAHDFNNILSSITGYTELALSKATDPEQHDDLDFVLTAAGRAADLIGQILAFSRMKEQEARPIRIAPLVKEVLKLLRASLPATVEVRVHLLSDATVVADPSEVHRVIVNLCTNAAFAMSKGGGIMEVSLTDTAVETARIGDHWNVSPGRYVMLTVRDTGCGIPPEAKDHIFEPFFTTRREEGGTGMGLSVVHGIVTSRKGSIAVYSFPGEGTTFEILLPAVTAVADEPPLTRIGEGRPVGGTERLLVVDDEVSVASLLKRLLEKAGYTVDAFVESPMALDAFSSSPATYDLLITDMTMPQLTGDILIQKIREIRPGFPVILCSGYSEKIDLEKAAGLGVDEFATKPLSGAKLTRLIRKVLDSRNSTP